MIKNAGAQIRAQPRPTVSLVEFKISSATTTASPPQTTPQWMNHSWKKTNLLDEDDPQWKTAVVIPKTPPEAAEASRPRWSIARGEESVGTAEFQSGTSHTSRW